MKNPDKETFQLLIIAIKDSNKTDLDKLLSEHPEFLGQSWEQSGLNDAKPVHYTPLSYAASLLDFEMVKHLIEKHQAAPNALAKDNTTALHKLVQNDKGPLNRLGAAYLTAQYLIKVGANPDITDPTYQTDTPRNVANEFILNNQSLLNWFRNDVGSKAYSWYYKTPPPAPDSNHRAVNCHAAFSDALRPVFQFRYPDSRSAALATAGVGAALATGVAMSLRR